MSSAIAGPSDLSGVRWRKSSHSGGNNECVEVAEGLAGAVPVRDSKDRGGPVLTFSDEAWAGFVAGVRAGEFDPR